jgi:hypothetical protein
MYAGVTASEARTMEFDASEGRWKRCLRVRIDDARLERTVDVKCGSFPGETKGL